MASFTKRNHYNPCFWTALWSEAYYGAYCSRNARNLSPRKQVVHALNVRADKILQTTVERVHTHNRLGVATITPESMKRFCGRWFPNQYKELSAYITAHPEELCLDFEDILHGTENMSWYRPVWMDVAARGDFATVKTKGFMTSLLLIHAMRSFEFMSMAVDAMSSRGIDKWEFFWLLKSAWSNPEFFAPGIAALGLANGHCGEPRLLHSLCAIHL